MTTKKSAKTKNKSTRDSVKSLRIKIEELESELSKQTEEIERISDKNIRLLAEFDNYKRRTQDIVAKLDKTLEDQGIVPFDSVGRNFDADLHEALMGEKSDKGENVILREFEKGYMYDDKILRHAKVVVSKS